MEYKVISLRERKDLAKTAAKWFNSKWGVPTSAYLECINSYINNETEYGWYVCLDGDKIVGGLGVIDNDFHDRTDLFPNICAVYVMKKYRCQGIAGKLLNTVVEDLRNHKISPVYLLTDHTNFYERYGFEFYINVNTEEGISRLYIHR